ncbi:hypothetical protein [Reichenbachiella sp. MSK19-1]|uniref:hypothetical protein n=1 Tax=Reichenbachiella sp. MSK19-1 TaxID=1897631 RepID=UPI0011C46EFD|nr:hypothetical protein [Reichenbachiella sp. MSK19-1]
MKIMVGVHVVYICHDIYSLSSQTYFLDDDLYVVTHEGYASNPVSLILLQYQRNVMIHDYPIGL